MNDRDPDFEESPYLWDGAGTPDAEVARLEKTLGVLRHRGTMPALPPRRRAEARSLPGTGRSWLAAAAALIVLATAGWFAVGWRRAAWDVNALSGAPAIEDRRVSDHGRLGRGEWLVTDGGSRARIAVGRIGSVDVEPNTRLQLVASGGREHRMTLDRGTIHARIWAPPKFFFVNTEAAVAVDLGCAYTLHVDEKGAGLLRVTRGWVGFEREGRETYVPEGAVCATRADLGPGTPRYEDAPSGYAQALMLLDFAAADDPRRATALDLVLSAARPRDGLTLWHLLTRGSIAERSRVYDRLAELVPPPPGVTRERILSGDREALGRWWDWLGIDVSTWWRIFKKTLIPNP
jgi:hypothetical protein